MDLRMFERPVDGEIASVHGGQIVLTARIA